jgi:glycosyltransferase involved in cell wall biosynthesis
MKEKTLQKTDRPEPLRILYIITKSNFGGATRYVLEMAKRAKEEGFETAVAFGGSGFLKDELEKEHIPGFSLAGAQRDIDLLKEFKLLIELIRIIHTWKPTVVHLNSPKIGGVGAVAARLLGVKKIIYTNHGWPFKEDRPIWQIALIRFFSWMTILANKTIIVLSETEKDFVKNWVGAKNKISVIPNGLSEFVPKDKTEALRLLLTHTGQEAEQITNTHTRIIGTISELHKNKGLGFALDGLQQYLDHEPHMKTLFIIIGEGERRVELETQIKALNMGKNVVLAGHVPDARNYLRAFDIFLLSSVKEGLPYAILEAGFAEVPVISTSVGGIPEVIRNFETGLLIPPKRPTEIKNALIYFDEHPEMIAAMKKNLKKLVAHTYNFNSVFERTVKLYRDR